MVKDSPGFLDSTVLPKLSSVYEGAVYLHPSSENAIVWLGEMKEFETRRFLMSAADLNLLNGYADSDNQSTGPRVKAIVKLRPSYLTYEHLPRSLLSPSTSASPGSLPRRGRSTTISRSRNPVIEHTVSFLSLIFICHSVKPILQLLSTSNHVK